MSSPWDDELTLCDDSRILALAAGRCVTNGSTAESKPDPFWAFPAIVLVGESENRLSCILGSIPIFWPMVEEAAERVHQIYRVFITEEFIVESSRVLPGQVTIQVGEYESPNWAERPSAPSTRSAISENHEETKAPRQLPSDVSLPPWPVTPPESLHSTRDQEDSEAGGGRRAMECSDEIV